MRGGQNIFDFRGGGGGGGGRGCPMRGVHFVGQFILHPFSHFEMQDSKIQTFHTFRSKADAGLQVDIDFNIESKFYFSRSSFFSPLSGHYKPIKPIKLLSFLSIWWV